MRLRALTNGSVSGTGTVSLQSTTGSSKLGGVLLTADGTNDATVVLKQDNASGTIVFKIVAKQPQMICAPIGVNSTALYYDISGTGAAAQLYEWVD